jgi:hypothetical protein
MARYERFTFLCDENEKRAIANLAARLQRSQSDAVRFVVVEAAKQLSRAEQLSDYSYTKLEGKPSQEQN